ncbi:protein rolling stone-like [Pieris brassicae]|uniref:protein rolling stone-like n=1 Tax=Pieris brassicae TaxID=7116 RepID=UPI001E65FE20|nr:protein rolling stone-like [Pieris brassicae]
MGAIKKYCKKEFQIQKFKFEYDDGEDFCIGCFQQNRSCLPLLIIRGLLFLCSVAIVVSSIVLVSETGKGAFWPIYLTHWGIFLMMVSTGFGFGISLHRYMKGPIDTSFGLPWYIIVYWLLYNVAVPLAVFITVFYWAFLSGLADSEEVAGLEFAPNKVLDIFIHAINSVVMLLLLLTSRHPMYLLHFYNVFGVALIYMFFSIIYWAAGGTDQFGHTFIYPMLDWEQPAVASIAVVFCAVLIIIVHVIITLLTVARDALGKRYRNDNSIDFSSNMYS